MHYVRPSDSVDSCEAGVKYDAWSRVNFALRPCFLTSAGESKIDAAQCEKLRRPTPDEIEAHRKWAAERTGNLLVVIAAIAGWRERNMGKTCVEIIACPSCWTGKLSLSIAGRSGHVHGRCSTPGCVRWTELRVQQRGES